ncbi:MAG: hypothetical protein MZU97_07810 [Bacillus subtilis]|nr:hypothetical protein [Bacillus subtilis]
MHSKSLMLRSSLSCQRLFHPIALGHVPSVQIRIMALHDGRHDEEIPARQFGLSKSRGAPSLSAASTA